MRSSRTKPASKLPRPDVPAWSRKDRALRWKGEVIKQILRDAESQVAVLAAFEKAGWPSRIDDPLPHEPCVISKQRIRDTVKNLNRRLEVGTIRFHTDGMATGFRWVAVRKQKKRSNSTSTPYRPLDKRA